MLRKTAARCACCAAAVEPCGDSSCAPTSAGRECLSPRGIRYRAANRVQACSFARVTNAASYAGGVACGKGELTIELTIHEPRWELPAIRAAEKDPSQSPSQAAQNHEGKKRENQHKHCHYCHACRRFKVIEHGHSLGIGGARGRLLDGLEHFVAEHCTLMKYRQG